MNAQLLEAVEESNTAEVQRVLELSRGLHISETLGFALCKAIENNSVEIAQLLLKFRADVCSMSVDGWRPIHYAAKTGNLDIMKLIIQAGSSMSTFTADNAGKTAMHIAVKNGHVPIVQYLVDKGAMYSRSKCHVEGDTPLHVAVKLGSLEMCRILLSKICHRDVKNLKEETALHIAVKDNKYSIISCLLDAGANIEETDALGKSALIIAADDKSLKLMTVLLQRGANPNAQDKRKRTCMHYLAMSRPNDIRLEMAKLLVAAGMTEINTDDIDHYTPLHYAAYKGNVELIRLMIAVGVQVNKFYPWRRDTPLNMAISCRKIETVKVLIEEGGVDVTQDDGKQSRQTALHKLMFFKCE